MRLGGRRIRAGAIGLALLLGGCRHYGGGWTAQPEAEPEQEAAFELLVIGSPRESSATRAVTRELAEQLRAATQTGRPAMILWLGSDLGPPGLEHSGRCPTAGELLAGPAMAELAATIDRAVEAGASSFGLPGPDAWRCGMSGLEAAVSPLPYQQPGVSYLVRISATGEVEVGSRCAGDRCELAPASAPALVELVVLDLSYWLFPELADPALTDALLGQQRSLLAALAEAPAAPRVLVSTIPIESAGTHGLGGRKQRTSVRLLPEFLREAIAAGLFVGTIGALERDLQASVDQSNAIIRGDRTFVQKPVFGLVSGSAGGAGHTLPTSRNFALLPDLWSEHPGFARLLISPSHADLVLHARVAGRWQQASVRVPLDPEPLPNLRVPPTIQPCPSCDPQAGAADGEVFVPRNERPR